MPAGAVIQRPQALSGFTGRKGCVGGYISRVLNPGSTRTRIRNGITREVRGEQNSWCRGEIR